MGARPWYEGSNDPVDNVVDVGPNNEYEPDQSSNSRASTADGPAKARKVIDRCVEFAAHDPADIMQECEEQDEMLGLEKGTTLAMFLTSINHTH